MPTVCVKRIVNQADSGTALNRYPARTWPPKPTCRKNSGSPKPNARKNLQKFLLRQKLRKICGGSALSDSEKLE